MARQLAGELDDARLEGPARLAHHVLGVDRHPERLERIVAAGLDAEVADDELHRRELADHRIELGGNAVRPVAGVDQDDDVVLRAHFHRRAQPVERAVGPVVVHVGVQLQHLEAVLLDVELELERALLRAEARIQHEIADEAVGILLGQLGAVRHVVADALAAGAAADAVHRVARRRHDEAHVDAARLAVDPVRPVHQLEHALAVERRAGMTPGLVDQIGGMQVGIDDHGQLFGAGVGLSPIMRAVLLPR